MKHTEACNLAKKYLEKNKCSVLPIKKATSQGSDLTVIKNGNAYRIEVKTAYKKKNGSFQISKIEPKRLNDDFLCVVFPNGYLHFEEMDFFKSESNRDTRTVTQLSKLFK